MTAEAATHRACRTDGSVLHPPLGSMKPTKVLAGVFCAFLLASPKGAITQGLCTIDTFAGGGNRPIPNDGAPAKDALLGTPYDLVADSAGNIFFTDTTTDQVRVIRPSGTVETFFGPQLISNGSLGDPRGLAIDAQRNLYVADSGRNFILRISPSGTATGYGTSTRSRSSRSASG